MHNCAEEDTVKAKTQLFDMSYRVRKEALFYQAPEGLHVLGNIWGIRPEKLLANSRTFSTEKRAQLRKNVDISCFSQLFARPFPLS